MKEIEIAQTTRRIGAIVIDYIIIFLLWYIFTAKDLTQVDELLKTLDPDIEGNLDIFVEELFGMYVKFILKWLGIQTVIFTLIPAIIGSGKPIGKLIFGIGVVNSETIEEISPSRLIFREFVVRTLFETLLIIPSIISIFMVLIRRDGRSIHDVFAKTIVIKKTIL